jgi:uncharacterized membrane-anchored protein
VRTALVFAGLVLALGVPNALVVDKERVIAEGTPMLLELAPADPRSLIQGDYMRLDYAITRQLADSARRWPATGKVVVSLDERGVARFVRRHDSGTALRPAEHLLVYRARGGRVRVGTDAFHFEEGRSAAFTGARYGELRVGRSGTSVLVALRDAQWRRLGGRDAEP